jgi:hypothetical protein
MKRIRMFRNRTVPAALIVALFAIASCTGSGAVFEEPSEARPVDMTPPPSTEIHTTDADFDQGEIPYASGGTVYHACAEPVDPPTEYSPFEAVWFTARFDNPNLPFVGIYAYFWVDWYMVQGCSFTPALVVLYLRDGSVRNVVVDGGFESDWNIEFAPEGTFGMQAAPLMFFRHAKADQEMAFVLNSQDFTAYIEIETNHAHPWNWLWTSYYDATIVESEIVYQGETYHPTGPAIVDRWAFVGGVDPAEPEADWIEGYWLFEPLSWTGPNGERLDTVIHYWVVRDETGYHVAIAEGVVSYEDEQWEIVRVNPDFDYLENRYSDGYLRRHSLDGTIEQGVPFSYEVSVVKEYCDSLPAEWETIFSPATRREAHSVVEGKLELGGVTYKGGGVIEWNVTTLNPLSGL